MISERVAQRLDRAIAYARWLGLLVVLLVTLATRSLEVDSPAWSIFIATAAMAVIDAVPVIMLFFHFFPEHAALVFPILDSIYTLVLLYLGGSSMLFYGLVPVMSLCIRFDITMALVAAAALAVGHLLFALIRAHFVDVSSVILVASLQTLGLLTTAVLGGLLAQNLKKEPPLADRERREIERELKHLRAAADRARAIYDMAIMLGATLNSDRILDAVLEVSTVGFDELTDGAGNLEERPAGAVFLFGSDGMYVAASRNIGYEEANQTVSGERGLLYRVMSGGKPLIVNNLGDDPDLRRFSPFRRCRSAVCVPLRAGFELYGAVVFASPVPNTFSEVHIELLTAVASQASVALNNAQLYQDIRTEKEKILEVGEDERSKLARDLHDGPTQSISAIAMRLNFARLLLDRDPQRVKDELFKLENLARRTTKEIRTMLFTLRPVVLETQGLKVAVEQLVEKLKETGELPVTLAIEDKLDEQIDVNAKAVAWFITEEALNNAKKYAEAKHIWVRMRIQDAHFVAEIEDDGKGFDYDATMANYDQRGSFGLLNYQERADLVGGRTVVRSTIGKGTRVTLVVPLHQEVV